MYNPFWNAKEHRLRAVWRLILQTVFFFLSAGIFTIILLLAVSLITGVPIDLRYAESMTGLVSSPLILLVSPLSMTGGIFFSYWLSSKILDRRPFGDFGFHFSGRWWADFGFGLGLGAILMVLIFLAELAAGWVKITGTFVNYTDAIFPVTITEAAISFICVGFYEEMWSRGYHLRNLAEGFNFRWLNPKIALIIGYVLSSAFFGFLHLGNPNSSLISTVNLVAAGLFLGLGYILTGELAISIGLHITWNFFQGNVFGFPVSGTSHPAAFLGIEQGGTDLWTGGSFGPEAGLIGLFAILLGTILIFLWVRWRTGQIKIQDNLAVYLKTSPSEAASHAEEDPHPEDETTIQA